MKIEIIVKGVSGKSGFFLIELPIELPIDSAWIHKRKTGAIGNTVGNTIGNTESQQMTEAM